MQIVVSLVGFGCLTVYFLPLLSRQVQQRGYARKFSHHTTQMNAQVRAFSSPFVVGESSHPCTSPSHLNGDHVLGSQSTSSIAIPPTNNGYMLCAKSCSICNAPIE